MKSCQTEKHINGNHVNQSRPIFLFQVTEIYIGYIVILIFKTTFTKSRKIVLTFKQNERKMSTKKEISTLVSSEDIVKDEPASAAYIYSLHYIKQCDRFVKVRQRASMTHELITAYKLLDYLRIISPSTATEKDLMVFHAEHYIHYLQNISSSDEDDEDSEYGLGYDCPLFADLYSYVCSIAGATLTAADCLLSDKYQIAINWGGGWHHAKRDEAAGFCYVNDIVLGILKLRTKYERILYIDLDAHHCDGVEDAFACTSKVMTVSFHKYETGFYPGDGALDHVGFGKGKYYSVNVPLLDGIEDKQYFEVFQTVTRLVKELYHPQVIVCQCGTDGLIGDPVEAFNLTPKGLGKCIKYLLSWNIPILFLGGGGYNISNAARCWTYLTSLILGKNLSLDIPENPYFMMYGPDFSLDITPGNRPNRNTSEFIDSICTTIAVSGIPWSALKILMMILKLKLYEYT